MARRDVDEGSAAVRSARTRSAVARVLFLLGLTVSSVALGRSQPLQWSPSELSIELGGTNSLAQNLTASLTSTVAADRVHLVVTGEIRSWVTITPAKVGQVVPGNPALISVVVVAPIDVQPGEYTGSIQVRSTGSDRIGLPAPSRSRLSTSRLLGSLPIRVLVEPVIISVNPAVEVLTPETLTVPPQLEMENSVPPVS